jgi:hypothetical protein
MSTGLVERAAMINVAGHLRARQAPDREGLYRADGTARHAEVDGPTLSWLDLGGPLDVHAMDDEDVIELDPAVHIALPDAGSVCCGEGPLGADGFFARYKAEGEPAWAVVLHNSNPFLEAGVEGMVAIFTNNLGHSLRIDLTSPESS